MKRKINEPLSDHTTFKIGGPAIELSIPEDKEELIREIRRCKKRNLDYKLLGKGSNILVSDKGVKKVIIKNTEACTDIKKNDDIVEVGSSVSLQKFVKFCVNNNLEGMEYLYPIPATVGGGIYMNAGRGRKHNLSISNNIVSVTIFDGNRIRELNKEGCEFDFRCSIFHEHDDWVILGAKFRLNKQPKEVGEERIKERMEFVKNSQDRKYPNAGSIFKQRSFIAGKLLNGLKIGGAQIKGNWISNVDHATFKDVLWLIRISKLVSYLTFKKPELEIEIWYN